MTRILFAITISTFLLSCGGTQSTEQTSTDQPTEATAPAEAAALPAIVEVVIEGSDLMQYNINKIEITEGQRVKLTLKHVGQMSAEAMGHNWVLLAAGTNVADFGGAAVSAKETGYIPEAMKDKVIANTQIIGGGSETTIEFDSPAAGYYDFICSFPGHYGLMKGTFTVLPK